MEGRKTIVFNAEMSCDGCTGAITRILQKIPGVADINCSLAEQRVSITADFSTDPQMILQRLLVWGEAAGKQVSLA